MKTCTHIRHCYRCIDCLSVFFVDGGELSDLHCACGGICECMGRVGVKRHLWREEERCACDARCTHATGPQCDCACRGENHGTGRTVKVLCDTGAAPMAANNPNAEQLAAWRAARAAAYERIASEYGHGNVDDYLHGIRIANYSTWRGINDAYREIGKARDARTHATRMKKIARVAA